MEDPRHHHGGHYRLPRRRRMAAAATSIVVAGLLLSASAVPAAGSPPARSSAPPAAAEPVDAVPVQAGPVDLAAGMYQVTLITGDRAVVMVDGRGQAAVEVKAVARPDGSTPSIGVTTGPDGVYAIPDDVRPLLAADRLDRDLFDLTYLAEHAYDDRAATALPVIIQYRQPAPAAQLAVRAEDAPASQDETAVALPSVNGAAVELAKAGLDRFWAQLSRTAPATATSPAARAAAPAVRDIDKVWLDRQVTVQLDESVPQIGAPQAWDAGQDGTGVTVAVLDTGVDPTHPDLAGQVVATGNFTGDETADDGHGHGTHVAATVAGTGAAQGGTYRGVAPGADLIIGKVLSDAGSGTTSGVINGMEWATQEQGADIVSMSLGGTPTDGTDPLSQAVDSLTEQTGTLFVIAAGNAGPDPQTVGSPGAASSALTVAAVTKSDELAGFSSRGPRLGDQALKPDIAAPGVNITAARAAGTSLCQNACIQPGDGPVDEDYTSASGTSMAAPHVSGAAAILAQRHPDWPPARLKAGLMSTATDAGFSVYEQGAGRVDVARAATQEVFSATANLHFGNLLPDDPAVNRTVSYTNTGSADVTLALTATGSSGAGPVPPGTLTVAPANLTVPAGGTAEATVTVTPPSDAAGSYSGRVTAAGPGGVSVGTPFGFSALSELVVTVDRRQAGADASAVELCDQVLIFGVAGGGHGTAVRGGACSTEARSSHRFLVPSGDYFVEATSQWQIDGQPQVGYLFGQDVAVGARTTFTLDADDARPAVPRTPRPAEPIRTFVRYERVAPDGTFLMVSKLYQADQTGVWLTPTPATSTGRFTSAPHFMLGAPAPAGTPVGERDYVYLLKPYQDHVPAQFGFGRNDVAAVHNEVHSDRGVPRPGRLRWYTVHPDFPALTSPQIVSGIPTPHKLTIYFGPIDSGAGYLGRLEVQQPSGRFENVEDGLYTFDQRRPSTIQWAERPSAPGPASNPGLERSLLALTIPLNAYKAMGCSACREGDQFNPLITFTTPAGRNSTSSVGATRPIDPKEWALEDLHLYDEDGNELTGYVHYPCDGDRHGACQLPIQFGER